MLAALCVLGCFAATLTGVSAGAACTFQPHCDYGHGSRDKAPASSKEACCTLCQARAGCAAGVLTGGECFFKTAHDVAGGCVKSPRAQFACLVPAPPAPPPPPPPPPSACTFQPNCDYGHGSRDRAPAGSKEECCTLCQAHAGCVAGVLTGGECFFKTAQDVEGGCVKSSRAQFGCLTPFVKQLAIMEKKYSALLNTTCAAVAAKAPALPSAAAAAFMAAFKNHTVANINPTQVLAAAQTLLALPAIKTFLSAEDSFATPSGMDATSVRCAVLFQGTPAGLAAFAAQSNANEALLDKLLGCGETTHSFGSFPIHGCLFCCAEPVVVNESVSTITKV
jgi:hypothetical protein